MQSTRQAGEGLGGAVERHIRGYFAAHKGGLPAAGLYDRVLREVERPLIVADPGRDPRQPDQGGPSPGPQPQHPAQEDPRIGHPSRPRPKIALLRPRFVGRLAFARALCRDRQRRRACDPERLAAISGSRFCMKAMRRVRSWAGRIGLRRKLAVGAGAAALGSGVATYLALTGAPPFGPHPDRRPRPAQPRPRPAAGAGRAGRQAAGAGVGRAAARPRRLAAADPAGGAVQPDRGDADDHRRGVLVSVLQLRRRKPGSATRCAPRSPNRWRSPKPISTSTSRRSAPMRWRWPTTSTATPPTLELNPHRLEQVVSAQAALRGLTEAVVFDRGRPCAGALGPVIRARLRAGPERCAARRRPGRRRDHDQRQRRPGARAGAARRVRRCLSLCRPLYRAAGAEPHRGDAARRSAIRAARRPAIRVPDHVRR